MLIILRLLNLYKQKSSILVALLLPKEFISYSCKHLLQGRASKSVSLLYNFKGSWEVKGLKAFNRFLVSY